MPHGIINALCRAEVGNKANGKQYGSAALENARADKDTADKTAYAAEFPFSRRLHESLAFVKTHIAFQHSEKHGNEGHKAESARLNQENDDDLPEQTPMRIGVVGDESRHAGRRSGREQGVYVRSGLAVLRRKGQRQQKAAQKDDGKIS